MHKSQIFQQNAKYVLSRSFFSHRFSGLLASSLGVFLALAMSGCLETRDSNKEQDEKVVMKTQVASLQRNTADITSRFQDIDDDLRKLSGRIEQSENRAAQVSIRVDKVEGVAAQHTRENEDKMKAYREELAHLNGEVEQLKGQLLALQDQQKRAADQAAAAQAAQAAAQAAASAQATKNPWAAGEEKFEQKAWKEAILDYERYRKSNPKGSHFGAATYKIGVAFQELGLIDEAKAFYEEVVNKYPKSRDAERAATRLKGLKKK